MCAEKSLLLNFVVLKDTTSKISYLRMIIERQNQDANIIAMKASHVIA